MNDLTGKHITIVGLGLMGGSLALALRPHVATLTAVEIDPSSRAHARQAGMVDRATHDLAEGVAGADVVVLATPVRTILQLVAQLPAYRPDGCLVIDLGSTKSEICRAMDRLPDTFAAIGGHPMCGKEIAGLAAAEADLFHGQTFILCPTARTTGEVEQVALALVEAVGGEPLQLEAGQHDRLVALASHLPYFVAALLMAEVAGTARAEPQLWPVTASGFRDTSRLAGSDATMLRDIVLTNRPAIVAALRTYQKGLDALLRLLEEGDEGQLQQWLAARQGEHAAYRKEKAGSTRR